MPIYKVPMNTSRYEAVFQGATQPLMARESTPEADCHEPFLDIRKFSGIFSSSFSLLLGKMLISRKREKNAGLAGDKRVMSIV
jgi:hypothetical protein